MVARTFLEIGTRFSRLIVLSESNIKQHGLISYQCLCDCGNISVIAKKYLLSGNTRSCGCLRKEIETTVNIKHGLSYSRTYNIWKSIKHRCFNENCEFYRIYGARGITICDKWKDSFESFYADMGECPPEFSIERINNDGNYEPSNCKWASAFEQSRNKSTNVYIEYNGERKIIADWSLSTGLGRDVITSRIKRNWTIEDALTIKAERKNRKHSYAKTNG